jgi:transposase-like protein
MKQIYHTNATTNVRLRTEINKSKLSPKALSLQYGVSKNTIYKWRNRAGFEDQSSRPNTIKYALSE